jgi:hypothetical protein
VREVDEREGMSDAVAQTEASAPETVAETPPPAVVETAPKPPTKRAAKPAAQEPRRMSDENQNATATPQINAQPQYPADLVQKLAQYEAMKNERDKMAAERESLLKAQEELKAAAASVNEKFTQTEAQAKQLAEKNRAITIQSAVRLAAMEAGAIDPDDVTTLLSGRFTLDESGAVITADDTKAKALDAVKSFLEKKPHLAGRKVANGSGASPFPAQSAPSAPKLDLNSREGATAYVDSIIARATPAPKTK